MHHFWVWIFLPFIITIESTVKTLTQFLLNSCVFLENSAPTITMRQKALQFQWQFLNLHISCSFLFSHLLNAKNHFLFPKLNEKKNYFLQIFYITLATLRKKRVEIVFEFWQHLEVSYSMIFSCRTESVAALGTAFLNLHHRHLQDLSKLLGSA